MKQAMKQAGNLIRGVVGMLILPQIFCMASIHEPEPFDLARYDASWHATHSLERWAIDTPMEPHSGRTPAGVKIESEDIAARTIRE